MVDVEESALRAFEQNIFAAANGVVQHHHPRPDPPQEFALARLPGGPVRRRTGLVHLERLRMAGQRVIA